MRCSDVVEFVHAYVDGEFAAEDRLAFETHLAECARCRELVTCQQAFKSNLRARLRRPELPAGLRLRVQVIDALDRADARGEGPVRPLFMRWPRIMPVGAGVVLAAAAALLVVFGASTKSQAASPIVEEAVHGHCKNLPVEVGGSEETIRTWMIGKVPVAVRFPHFRQPRPGVQVTLIGGRLGRLFGRDAAQLNYRVGGSKLTNYQFDPTGIEMGGQLVHEVGGYKIYAGQFNGYNAVFYRDRGLGNVFTSDLDYDDLVALVALSLRPDER